MAPALHERRYLRNGFIRAGQPAVDHQRVGVPEDVLDRSGPFLARAALPHLDDGTLLRIRSHQWCCGMQHLEIAAYRQRLAELGAIVNLQHGHHDMARTGRRSPRSLNPG